MINEIVNEIALAEQQAKDIIEQAYLEAKNINVNAMSNAETIKEKARATIKKDRENVVLQAMSVAEKDYNDTILLGEEKSRELIKNTSTILATKTIVDKLKMSF